MDASVKLKKRIHAVIVYQLSGNVFNKLALKQVSAAPVDKHKHLFLLICEK